MNQYRLTAQLVGWLKANPWKPSLIIRYDGRKTSQYTPQAEHCSLYTLVSRKKCTNTCSCETIVCTIPVASAAWCDRQA